MDQSHGTPPQDNIIINALIPSSQCYTPHFYLTVLVIWAKQEKMLMEGQEN